MKAINLFNSADRPFEKKAGDQEEKVDKAKSLLSSAGRATDL